jgi:hypothetical protein
MDIITEKTTVFELKTMAKNMFGNLVKAVVDVEKKIMVVDAELHADEEALLLENGSRQEDLWGINLYPEFDPTSVDFIEFDSMINLRPSTGNRSRGVEDPETRRKIIHIIHDLIL